MYFSKLWNFQNLLFFFFFVLQNTRNIVYTKHNLEKGDMRNYACSPALARWRGEHGRRSRIARKRERAGTIRKVRTNRKGKGTLRVSCVSFSCSLALFARSLRSCSLRMRLRIHEQSCCGYVFLPSSINFLLFFLSISSFFSFSLYLLFFLNTALQIICRHSIQEYIKDY